MKLGNKVTRNDIVNYASMRRELSETKDKLHELEMRSIKFGDLLPCEIIELQELKSFMRIIENNIPIINNYTDNVINKDKHYFSKLSAYNLDNDLLKYCL